MIRSYLLISILAVISLLILLLPQKISCPSGYIFIPGNHALQSKDFCVAQFEMKNERNVPVSKPSGTPWSQVSRNMGISLCASLGKKYQLISNQQWQTVAHDIERQPGNWSSGVVGKGTLNIGNYSYEMGGVIVDDPCITEGFPIRFRHCTETTSVEFVRKRSHVLSTGEVIWDIGGNVGEWTRTNTGATVPNHFRGMPCETKGEVQFHYGPAQHYDRTCDASNSDGFGCIEGEFGSVIIRGGGSGMEGSAWKTCPGILYANYNSFWGVDRNGPGFRCVFELYDAEIQPIHTLMPEIRENEVPNMSK